MSADYEKTITLGQEADKLKTRGEYDAALAKYQEAWEIIPSDKKISNFGMVGFSVF